MKLSLKQNCSGVGFKFLELVSTCKSIFDDTKDSTILSSREHLFQDLNRLFIIFSCLLRENSKIATPGTQDSGGTGARPGKLNKLDELGSVKSETLI